MLNEIGSEFWNDIFISEYIDKVPEWLNKFGNIILTSSGRGAISLLLKNAEIKTKTALLPAYICDSVIFPFLKEEFTCYFYDINTDLTPNLESIEHYMTCDIGVFFYMGYYGFNNNSNLSNYVNRLKENSAIVVEDITHTLFSDYERLRSDYYVASLRKWMGIPSGGFLASQKSIEYLPQQNDSFANIRKEALLIKNRCIKSPDECLKKHYLELFEKGEELLDRDAAPYYMDLISKTIINVLDIKQIKEKRQSNFNILSYGLKGVPYVDSVFYSLPNNICPLFYPLIIKGSRNNIRQKLIEHKIYCPIHWPVPAQIQTDNLKNTKKIYDNIISIPCDQRYGKEEMERIISVLRR